MPESDGVKQRRQKKLCDAGTFLHYLGVEIERHTRYNRDFTTVLIQPPADSNQIARLQVAWAASSRAVELLRTCDLITIFESSAIVVALLPETGSSGARIVFDRFDEQMVEQGAGWTLKMATYPEHAESIEYFLQRFSELLRSSDPETDPSETDASLWHATADVSDNWRDLTRGKGRGSRRSAAS